MKAAWFNQPWLARAARTGRPPAAATAASTGTASASTNYEMLGDATTERRRRAPEPAARRRHGPAGRPHDRDGPAHAAAEGLRAAEAAGVGLAGAGPGRRRARAAPGRRSATHALAGAADARIAAHFPADAADAERGRGRGSPTRSSSCTRRRSPLRRGERDEGRAADRRSRRAGRARSRAGSRSLPFEPTGGPASARSTEIDADLALEQPMQRLLMGEVGSGKTVVALSAMLRARRARPPGGADGADRDARRAALRDAPGAACPAEAGARRAADRLDARRAARATSSASSPAASSASIVGTHALIEDDVRVRLARASPSSTSSTASACASARAWTPRAGDGLAPHVLHMTATPIPRTLALLGYGDLDVDRRCASCPRAASRSTPASSSGERERAARLRAHPRASCARGARLRRLPARQRVRGAPGARRDGRGRAPARPTSSRGFRVALLHGQMPPAEKAAAMRAFAAGEADVLVATTRDRGRRSTSPNATVMLVEDAERYGISQLHQLRGRVGRGEHASLCLLFGARGVRAAAGALAEHERDGFRLAEIDLRAARGGRAAGTRQSGAAARSAYARLPEDAELLRARPRERCATSSTPTPTLERARASGCCATPLVATRGDDRARRDPRVRAVRPMRIVAGALGGRRHRDGRRATRRGRRPTGCARRCSRSSGRSTARACSTCSPAPARSAIEALSRGAAHATLVEKRRPGRAVIARNLETLGVGAERGCSVLRMPAERALRTARERGDAYDLVFLRPSIPAGAGRLGAQLAADLAAVLAPGARVVTESDRRAPLDAAELPTDRRAPLRRHADPHPRSRLMTPTNRVAVCPGSATTRSRNGHLDVIGRAAEMYDEVVVAVVNQPVRKSKTLFTPRSGWRSSSDATADLPNVEVGVFDTLVVDFAREDRGEGDRQGPARDLGLRVRVRDEPAQPQARPRTSRALPDGPPAVQFPLARSGIKELATFGGDVSDLVPQHVAAAGDRLSAVASVRLGMGKSLQSRANQPPRGSR